MSKRYGFWRGRPNEPPLNWHKPHEPVVRKVVDGDDDEARDTSPFKSVWLPSSQWVNILRALYLYGQKHGDPDWEEWRVDVRALILAKVDPECTHNTPIKIDFTVNNWRRIWKALKMATADENEWWQGWFEWISENMTNQIVGQR